MRVRWIGLALALVLLGSAAGYAYGHESDEGPRDVGAAHPIAAVDPSWPAEPAEVLPDSPFPALATGVKTHLETVGSEPFALRVPIPNHWVRSNSALNEWKWYPADDFEYNTYFLRVGSIGPHQPIPTVLSQRIAALEGAESVKDLDIESQTADSFTATYVSDKHRRLNMERVLPAPDGTAMVWIALIGRMSDREGMAELFPRITNGVSLS
ncbi:hypothetical protein [Nocardioides sp. SR21]|uniref:hypothetical protein n=1 Tax=Nocardioides sp. SR21 TaxID=2919501 RepID=UPI001FA9F450|nr:hypothetical protein [Nocardioides sp. SR21]